MGARLTFGFIHGGSHGAWSWQRVIGALDVLGHRGIAPDMPCSDEEAGAERYAEVMLDALTGVEEPVVLVAHSLGGLTLPLVAARRPTRRMVFLAAILPVVGKSFRQQRERDPAILFPRQGAHADLRYRFYNTCSTLDATWAFHQLRYQSERPRDEVTPLAAWPEVSRDYILCTEDHACNPEWSRREVPEILDVRPIELTGSDHSPFLHHPADLAKLLVELSSADR